jgi:hypothetical protein
MVVIAFCNICTVATNNKEYDPSGLNGMPLYEGSRMPKFRVIRKLSFLHFVSHFFRFRLRFLSLCSSFFLFVLVLLFFLHSYFILFPQSKCLAIPGYNTYILSHRYSNQLGKMSTPKVAALYLCKALVTTY